MTGFVACPNCRDTMQVWIATPRTTTYYCGECDHHVAKATKRPAADRKSIARNIGSR